MDKLPAGRFKKRGMNRTAKGADCICQVIEPRVNVAFTSYVTDVAAKRRAHDKAGEAAMASLRREVKKDPEAWC